MSVTAVSLTYCIQAFAIASFGSQAAFSGSPANFAAGTASLPVTGASHAPLGRHGCERLAAAFGRRAVRQASSHGIAR